MSLYNILHGVNPLSKLLKAILGIDIKELPWPKDKNGNDWDPGEDDENPAGLSFIQECIDKKCWTSGRFRDIYLNEDGTKIILFTRNGGGNREAYWYMFDIIKKHPNYIFDYDDSFDSTYTYIEFSIPEKFKDLCSGFSTGVKPATLTEKFEKTINEMKSMSKEELKADKRFTPLIELMEKILEQLNDEIEE